MDLYVEKQCLDQMKAGDSKKFLILFDAYFSDLYRYVFRRVNDSPETERIVRTTFSEALSKTRNTPTDIAYQVWLYSLAKPKVWNYIDKSRFPDKQGLIDAKKDFSSVAEIVKDPVVQKAENMLKKMSLEESEILRLKFCEELADGDVLYILGGEENTIGSKIYRVLKRAHFLLFGESDERHGIYFGELSGFLSRVKDSIKIEVPESLKLSLKAELSNKLDKKEFAVDAQTVSAESKKFPDPLDMTSEIKTPTQKVPWQEFKKDDVPMGSNDPAKIFVQAVKEMRQEEEAKMMRDAMEFEASEKVYDFFDRWKGVLSIIPVILFIAVGVFVVTKIDWGKTPPIEKPPVEIPFVSVCGENKVNFDKSFSKEDVKNIDELVNKKICEAFSAEQIIVKKISEKEIEVLVDAGKSKLEYRFVRNLNDWALVKYAKTSNSDKQSRQVQRDYRSPRRA